MARDHPTGKGGEEVIFWIIVGLLAAFFGNAIYAQLLPLLGLGDGGVLVQAFG